MSVYQTDHADINVNQIEGYSLLNLPLGGALIQQEASEEERIEAKELPRLVVEESVLMDSEQIVTGVYSPIDGFMDSETLGLVLDENTLRENTCWTLPILFQVKKEVGRSSGRRFDHPRGQQRQRAVFDEDQ